MFRLTSCIVLLAVMLPGCKSVGPDIHAKSVVDSKANLKGYRTYAWLGSLASLEDPQGDWEPAGFDADSELRFLIDQQLRQRGFTFAQDRPDAYVAYFAAINTDTGMQADAIRKHFGDEADLSNTAAGALIIGLADPNTEKMIWAGAATAQVKRPEERTPELAKARLALAVKKIFEQYPK